MEKKKIIGLGLMAPAAVLAIYIILSIKMWIMGILAIVFTGMAMVGWNLFKGMSVKDAVKDVKKDVKEI